MSAESQVMELFERANPVPDLDAVHVEFGADRFLTSRLDESSTMIMIEPNSTPERPHQRRWVWPALAAAITLAVVAAGLVIINSDDTTPADTPTPTTTQAPTTTTPDTGDALPAAGDMAVVDAFFGAYNDGDTDGVLATVAPDVLVTETYRRGLPSPDGEPYTDWDQRLAWNHAQGEILTEPTCRLADDQPPAGATLDCAYTTLDVVVQAVSGTPIPTQAWFTVADGVITEIHQGYGKPDFASLGGPFADWMEETHPEITGAGFSDWKSLDEAVEHGRIRVQWAQEWARFLEDVGCSDRPLTCDPTEAVIDDAAAVTFAPPLAVPIDGETQQTIVGNITWTRVQGDITTVPPKPAFVFDGVFYGNRLGIGDPSESASQPQWWTSSDGVGWEAWDAPPAFASVTVAGDTLWAQFDRAGPPGGDNLQRWDGTSFVPVDLPAAGGDLGDGLKVRFATSSIRAEFAGQLIVHQRENIAVAWEDLLGIEPPFEAVEEGGEWTNTFRVRVMKCSTIGDTRSCGSDNPIEGFVIRPEIVEDTPTRIDLYRHPDDELIVSIVPPAVDRPIDEIVFGIGAENSVGNRQIYVVADLDGTNTRLVDWPFDDAQFTELDGRLFALAQVGDDQQLWASDDLVGWEQLELPAGVSQEVRPQLYSEVWSGLSSDGLTMTLETTGRDVSDEAVVTIHSIWSTTDGVTWTARETALPEYPTAGGEPHDFGWMDHQYLGLFDEQDLKIVAEPSFNGAPTVALSPDAETWQILPIPVPSVFDDRGLTWADLFNGDDYLPVWDSDAYALGDTIFIVHRSSESDREIELWAGSVTPT